MTADVSFDPRTGLAGKSFAHTSSDELEVAVGEAIQAMAVARLTSPKERQTWLCAIAEALETEQIELARLADTETALGLPRLEGEIARTAGQLRFYAEVACEGSYLRATLDEANGPTPAIARTNVPLGVVAVFGASNFPFAFSVLGNDTASALAVGCAVVVKAHPAHPELSHRLHQIARDALHSVGAPVGLLGLVRGFEAGISLVKHPDIAAVAFTGSQGGGMSLWQLSNQREVVIPVFAEMGTINPVLVTPAGAAEMSSIAEGFVGSFTLDSGQFCTKPGLLFAPRSCSAIASVIAALEAASPRPVMLTREIADAVETCVEALRVAGGVVVGKVKSKDEGWAAPTVVLTAPIEALVKNSRLLEECFGPVAIIVEYDRFEDALAVLDTLQGALAGSIMMATGDLDAEVAIQHLQQRVGRVMINDWPTGVSYTWAQHHGGPWPATSNPGATSVGASALDRFVRPVAFQSVPEDLLPPALQRDNPWAISRRINGVLKGVSS